nr:reverse transcriptase domain-containing protein [Tanacetum cinerariifolium]
SRTTSLRNEISNFEQKFGESFHEAWDKYKDLLRACPHQGFTELHQLNTFYNALNPTEQDSFNDAASVNEQTSTMTTVMMAMLRQFHATPPPAPVKAVEETCFTCRAAANYNQGNPGYRPQGVANQIRPPGFAQSNVQNNQNRFGPPQGYNHGSRTLPGNTVTNPKEDLKGIITRSGVAYNGPTIHTPAKVVKQGTEATKDQVQTPSPQNTAHVQPPVTQSETSVSEPIVAPVSTPMPNLKPLIPYPSRHDNERHPLIGNKEKLIEMAQTPMNEHCSTVILNKLPKKLRDPGKFLIPCEFPGMDECLALADLDASINLMPLFVWKELSLLELTPTCMTLELVDRSVSKPIGIAKNVKVKVGMFHFPAHFMVVDFEPDPRVPLILGRCFLKAGRALIDVHKGELTLRIENEAVTYNLDQTSRYSANYDQMTANKIDVTDEACEEYFQEVLGFSNVTASGSPTPFDDPQRFSRSRGRSRLTGI